MTRSRRLALLTLAYMTQGMAPAFTSFAMPVLLRAAGHSLTTVGLAGLLFWPWAVKFLWGPLTDTLARGRGHRWWIGALVALLVATLALLSLSPASGSLRKFVILIGVINIVASALDVATEGITLRVLDAADRPLGSTAQLAGYYAGALVAGGGFLAIEAAIGWERAITGLAILVAVGGVALLALERAVREIPLPARGSVTLAMRELVLSRRFLLITGAIIALDLTHNLAIDFTGPALLDGGLPQATVGWLTGPLGMGAAITGSTLAGLWLLGRPPAQGLLAFALLQVVGLAVLAAVIGRGVTPATAVAAVAIAYALAAAFNTALGAWFLHLARPATAATDLSLFSCVHNATYVAADPMGGVIAARRGFSALFIMGAAATLSLLPVARAAVRRLGPADLPGPATS